MEKFHYHPDVWHHVHKYSFPEISYNKEMFVSKLEKLKTIFKCKDIAIFKIATNFFYLVLIIL